jgi:mono/diheme cytochrome c family protein
MKTTSSNIRESLKRYGSLAIASILATCLFGTDVVAETPVERGRYLVTLGGCHDCHTPGYFLGKPDEKRFLGGSDVGFLIPGVGTVVGPNLTSDRETGLGSWSAEEIVTALQTGVRPDGRELSPVMPWPALAKLKKDDAYAIAAYLKTLPPISNAVPGPFGPGEKQVIPVLSVIPPQP